MVLITVRGFVATAGGLKKGESIPIFGAGTGQQSVTICEDYVGGNLGWPHPKFNINVLGGPVVVTAPAGEVRPSGPQGTDADGHLVIYDASTRPTTNHN